MIIPLMRSDSGRISVVFFYAQEEEDRLLWGQEKQGRLTSMQLGTEVNYRG
jgi:hypothetical protein